MGIMILPTGPLINISNVKEEAPMSRDLSRLIDMTTMWTLDATPVEVGTRGEDLAGYPEVAGAAALDKTIMVPT